MLTISSRLVTYVSLLTWIPVTTTVTPVWPVRGCDLPRVPVTTERRRGRAGPCPHTLIITSPLTPTHHQRAQMSERSSIPSLIVLLDFVLKVLKLCLVFDQLFRVRSEEHNQNITKQKSRFSSLYIFVSLLLRGWMSPGHGCQLTRLMFVMRPRPPGDWPVSVCHSRLKTVFT